MPLISSSEEKLLDTISAAAGGIALDKFKLKEFAFVRAKNAIIRKHPDWVEQDKIDAQTMSRLIELNVQLDFSDDIHKLVKEFIEACSQEIQTPEVAEVIEQHETRKKTILDKEIPEVHKDRDIDKPVAAGRRTKLHLACEAGNYDEVVRLVETCGAKVTIKDASNWTPKDRARLNNRTPNHAKIVVYLEQFA